MRNLLVKICGITNVPDAIAAIDAGADFVGLILVPGTPRFVSDEIAREIVLAVGGKAKTVGVFRNVEAAEITAKRSTIGFDIVQLHGDEPQYVVDACAPCIKACSKPAPNVGADLVLFDRPKGSADENWLENMLDALANGTGGRNPASPFLLAGGITIDRIPVIKRQLENVPSFAGLDVASGVERAPGLKDHDKLRRFIFAVKEANRHAITG